jgi:beta-galactosidase
MQQIRQLINGSYFPFGSQYYRAPSPDPADWETDLRHFAEQGLNTVKFWVQWRWNHPAEDRFYWDDIDRLMDLAQRFGLHVMLNTIVDVTPAWIYQKYPDASMITRDGRKIGPQTQGHRQIGGLGLCLCHEEAVGHMMDWLAATVQRYTQHPALAIWNVGSEPELTQSMSEMRLYANDHTRMGDMLDYNPRSIAAFRHWLAEKYNGDLDELNRRWNRNYTSFEQAEVPLTRNTFNDIVDWRMFFVHVLGENVRRRFEVCKQHDAGRHPTMCHHVTIEGFPITSTGNDPWNVAQYGEMHGATQMLTPFMLDVLRSAAKDKPVLSAEQLGMLGYTLGVGEPMRPDDVKRLHFTAITAGARGILYWQYRPELLGREAPTWGLTTTDGALTPWLETFSQCGRAFDRISGFLLDCQRRPADVALLFSPENQIFQWAASGTERTATESLVTYHQAFYEANLSVDLIHPREIRAGILDRYRAVVLPAAYWIEPDIAAALERWVQAGGFLLGELYTAGWQPEQGRHQPVVPGYGLDRVFGARQGTAFPLEKSDPERAWLRWGEDRAYGRYVRADLLPDDGAEVLGTWESNPYPEQPVGAAVVRHRYGRGQAVLAGTYLGLAVPQAVTAQLAPSGFTQTAATAAVERAQAGNRALIRRLFFEAFPDLERPTAGHERIRIDVLIDGPRHLVVLKNLEAQPAAEPVRIPGLSGALSELFGQGTLDLDGEGRAQVDLPAGAVRAYIDF